jgi:C-terminal processing protease CtpA/Prc
MREPTSVSSTLARWRTARRSVLGAIVLAGAVATSAAVFETMRVPACPHHKVDRAYTYSGVGVVIERDDADIVVKRVMPGTPADGKLLEGARLVRVDGMAPATLEEWASAIRGAPGSIVELEVAYACGGHKTIAIERGIVHMEY